MPTGNSAGLVATGDEGRERNICKRRHDESSSTHSPTERSVKKRRLSCEVTQDAAPNSSMHTFEASGTRGNRKTPVPQSSATHAFVNSEALRFGRLEAEYLASVGRSMELSRLANLAQPQSPAALEFLNSIASRAMIAIPPLQYPPILGSAFFPGSAFAYSPVASIGPIHSMIPSLPRNNVAGRPNYFPCNSFLELSRRLDTLDTLQVPQGRVPALNAAGGGNFRLRSKSSIGALARPVEPSLSNASLATEEARPDKRKTQDDPPAAVMTLYSAEDRDKLSNHQAFLRKQIEIFRATEEDILSITRGKNKPIVLQQVGLRCRHCGHIPAGGRTKGATYFPSSLMGVYQAAQNMCVEHFQSGRCTELPPSVRERFSTGTSVKNMASVVGKKYWADGARKLGLVDTDDGIRFATDIN